MNSSVFRKTTLFSLLLGIGQLLHATVVPGSCPSIYAGLDQTVCRNGPLTLDAQLVALRQTTDYTVSSIPFVPISAAAAAGTAILVNQDDVWSSVVNLPFNFCFYGNNYSSVVVGANGQLSFNTGLAGLFSQWNLNGNANFGAIPGNNPAMQNAIGFPYHDMNPTINNSTSRYIKYSVAGTAPCRTLTVTFFEISMHSVNTQFPFLPNCNNLRATQQVVLFETTNAIEVHITNKPICTLPANSTNNNNGNAILGIQNSTGTAAVTPPNRNHGTAWSTTNEAWRFSPSGTANYTVDWLQGATVVATNTETFNPSTATAGTTTYTARITYTRCDGSTLVLTDDVTVTVSPAPTAGITPAGPTAICNGTNVTLTGTGGVNYAWSAGSANATQTVNAAGTYTVTVTGANTCTATASRVVTLNPSPTVTISGGTNTCPGNPITLTANGSGGTGGLTYTWTNGLPAGSSNTFTPPNGTTVYGVTATDANGCTAGNIAVVNTNLNAPTASLTSPGLQIVNTPTTISGTFAAGSGSLTTYSWNFGSNATPPTANTAGPHSVTYSTAGPHTVTVTITNSNGCTATAQYVVNTSVPTTCIPSGCFGSSIVQDGSFSQFNPATPFQFFSSNYDYSNCPLASSPCVNGSNVPIICSYDFGVETGPSVCNPDFSTNIHDHTTGTGNMMIIDFPTGNTSPNTSIWCQTVTLLPNTDYCFGAYFINLLPTGTGYVAPQLSFSVNGSVLATPVGIGETEQWEYRGVQFNSGAGGTVSCCINHANFGLLGYDLGMDDVAIRPVLNGTSPTANNDNLTYCGNNAGSTNVLSNDVAGTGTISALTISSAPPFTDGSATADLATGTVTFTPLAGFTGSTSFQYQICNTSGCCSTATVNVTNATAPTVTITPAAPTAFCTGGSVVLTATGGGTYSWSNGLGANAATTPITTAGTYTVTVTNAAGCTATANRVVTVNAAPTAVITPSGPTALCSGGTVSLVASGGTSYLWANNTTSNTRVVSATANYCVTVTNAAGCTASTCQQVTVNPALSVNAGPDGLICGAGTTLNATATGGTTPYTYTWDNGLGTGASQNVNPANTTTYNVTVTDNANCSATDQVVISTSPLSITPNVSLCPGQSTPLAVSGNLCNITWAPATGLSSTNTQTVTATPTATTTYTATITQCGTNLVTNPSFTLGNTGFTTLYQPGTGGSFGLLSNPTTYAITTSPNLVHNNFVVCADHTGGGGNMFVANGATTPNTTVWSQSFAVTPNTTYQLGVWGSIPVAGTPTAQLQFAVNGVAVGGSLTLPNVTCTWTPLTATWNSGAATSVTFEIRDLNTAGPGNDFMIDDITFSPTCVSTQSVTVTVNPTPTPTITGTTSICAGASTILTATGGGTYSWSNGLGTAATTTPITTAGTYTVTVTNNGCSATQSAVVTTAFNPVINITGNTTFCAGGSTTLNASGGTAYAWSNGLGNAATTLPITSAGTYTVTVTNSSGCTGTASATVTVNSNPTITITGNTAICAGTTTTLTANGGGTYAWSNGLGNNATSNAISAGGTYTVTVTNVGCTATGSALVTVNANPVPVITPSGSTVLCAGATVDLVASGGTTYLWSDGSTNATLTATTSGNYCVTVTNAAGCTASICQTVTINPTLTVDAGPDGLVCGAGTTLNALATGGTSPYTYTWDNGLGNGASHPVTPSATTTYNVTVTDASNCTATDQVVITYETSSISPNVAFCEGGSTTLSVTGGNVCNVEWSPSNGLSSTTGQSVTASPNTTTTYTATIYQCSTNLVNNPDFSQGDTGFTTSYSHGTGGSFGLLSNPATYAITTNPNLVHVNFANCVDHTTGTGNMFVANGDTTNNTTVWSQSFAVTPNTDYLLGAWASVVVEEIPTPQLQFRVNGVTIGTSLTLPNTNCLWSPMNEVWNSGSATSVVFDIINLNTAQSGNDFMLDDISFTPTCISTETVTVTVNPAPVVATNTATNISCAGLCDGTSTIVPTVAGTYNYQWFNSGGTSVGNNTTGNLGALCQGTYTVTITNTATACSASSNLTITEPAPIVITPALSPEACLGDDSGDITLNITPPAAYTYLWSNQATSSSINNLTPGTYAVTVTSGSCTATWTGTLPEGLDVNVTASATPVSALLGTSIDLSATVTPSTAVLTWIGTDGFTGTGANLSTTPDTTTTYTVTATEGTCIDVDTVMVTIFSEGLVRVGNAFTPNGDGQNDLYFPSVAGSVEVLSFRIYDRWGHKVFDNKTTGWNGEYNGDALPRDSYVWVLSYRTGDGVEHVEHGDVTLLR